MSESGAVAMPTVPVWMTQYEIADLFGVFSFDIRKAMRAIYRNRELDETETMLYVRQPDRTSLDTYNIDMVIAVAFKVRSRESTRFRKFITDRLYPRNGNTSVSLFVSCRGKSSLWDN